ncbi:MAG TPA: serine protease [Stellaceae bacterium]|jgi:S1-C subfamily serine protease|nr:serine protease [Stellaceae bacterium]
MIGGDMVFAPRFVFGFLLAVALLTGGAPVSAQNNPAATTPPAAEAPRPVSSTAERIFETARGKLLQIRTELAATGRQSTLGSAFLVDNELAITNYHVVSQYVLEPDLYRLEYFTAANDHGSLQVLGFDIADDLALVKIDHPQQEHLTFDPRKLDGLTKGEQLYAMGNPLDIGFAIVEGTYNGLVERSYTPHIHFSGAVNPGMSGGPAVATDGDVVGINVATRRDGELVSFLVPAQFAVALLAQAPRDPPKPKALRTELARQVAARESALYAKIESAGLQAATFGPYVAGESKADWFTCWGQTNAAMVPKPRATVETTNCSGDSDIFVADDLRIGHLFVTHSYIRSVDLNAFQFATYVATQNGLQWPARWRERWYTPPRCTQDFTRADAPDKAPPVEAIWCARAYKDFPDLYDIALTTITQDRNSEALVSRLSLQAVTYEAAQHLARQFLTTLQWHK